MNQRDKIGVTGIDWKRFALGRGKFRRKTVGFGKYDKKERESETEVYLRELSILDGGIGCAVWDAAIILSRMIFENPTVFVGKEVLELGSGVGLPGILCAKYANRVVLTDYLEPILDNLRYNIELNSDAFLACDDDGESSKFASCCSQVSLGEENGGEPAKFPKCSRIDELQEVVAMGSETSLERIRDIGNHHRINRSCSVHFLDWDQVNDTEPLAKPFELVLGSELTYSVLSITTLAKTFQVYLAKGGVVYEMLSDDRDGVVEFCDLIATCGFRVFKEPVPERSDESVQVVC